MKKLLLFWWCLSIFCSNGKAQITINTNQVEMFHKLMSYSEEKAGGKLHCKHATEAELKATLDKNSNDSKLASLVDSLLNSSVLYLPRNIQNVRLFPEGTAGRDAYKIAFTVLPDFCVGITAGMPYTWVEYWNDYEFREHVASGIIELNANKKEIIESIKTACKMLLPDDVDMDAEINIHIIADGNRASFQFDNNVMMDIVSEKSADFPRFISVLKHEMHHAYYRKWLAEKTSNKKHNEVGNYLYQYQMGFIFEGIAQRYTQNDLSVEVKQMYANRELITELFDEWISLIRGMKSDSPQLALLTYQESLGDVAIERLKKYYPSGTDSMEYEHRPRAIYYLSYNMYNSIFESGGNDKLKYVIENPDKLLLVYNELHTDSMLIPPVPDDVVMFWRDNF